MNLETNNKREGKERKLILYKLQMQMSCRKNNTNDCFYNGTNEVGKWKIGNTKGHFLKHYGYCHIYALLCMGLEIRRIDTPFSCFFICRETIRT